MCSLSILHSQFVFFCFVEGVTEDWFIPFHVYHKQEHRNGKTHVAYVKEVHIEVYGVHVEFHKGAIVVVRFCCFSDISLTQDNLGKVIYLRLILLKDS